MIVLKDFKTVNQVFTAGQTFFENIEDLESWVERGFVALEEAVAHTEVPTI